MATAHTYTDSFGDTLEISTHGDIGVVFSAKDRRTAVDIAVLKQDIPALIKWLQATQDRS